MVKGRPVDVLLVEDSPTDIELALRALKRSGLSPEVAVVKDGAEALDFVFGTGAYHHRRNAERPKVILLDLKLPKVSGLQVLRLLKTNERTKVIPVVVLTSSHEERDAVECYRLGVNSYVVKPVEFEPFMSCVSELGIYWLQYNEPPQ